MSDFGGLRWDIGNWVQILGVMGQMLGVMGQIFGVNHQMFVVRAHAGSYGSDIGS